MANNRADAIALENMKRYCKEVNILDMDFLRRCARDCLKKKWKRNDVTRFFVRLTGWSKDDVVASTEMHQLQRHHQTFRLSKAGEKVQDL